MPAALTLFTVPRPFTGDDGVRQRNAIGSWRALYPTAEIRLYGDEEGIERAAQEFSATWIPHVEKNAFGTPLLSSVFRDALRHGRHRLLCYLNTDIIVLDELSRTLAPVQLERFLLSGRRWNLDVNHPIDFSNPSWIPLLQREARQRGSLFHLSALDYFVFPRTDVFGRMPAFAVGRPAWDNWMIRQAVCSGIAVVDATQDFMVVHQNHGYAHVAQRTNATWEGPEADRNRVLAGGAHRLLSLEHADAALQAGRWVPIHGRMDVRRLVFEFEIRHPRTAPVMESMRILFRQLGLGVLDRTGRQNSSKSPGPGVDT